MYIMKRDFESPDQFAEQLTQYGMPEKQAEVYAHKQFGKSVSEIASELDKDKSTVSGQHDTAVNYACRNARGTLHLTEEPLYLTNLPEEIGSMVHSHGTIPEFRLHRPQKSTTSDSRYTLNKSEVIEFEEVNGLAHSTEPSDGSLYLITYYRYESGSNTYGTDYFTIKKQYITRFLLDWVIPNRYSEINEARDSEYADKWFLTKIPDWGLEDHPYTGELEPTRVFVDDRFENPLENEVSFELGGSPTNTHHGCKSVYEPTTDEISEAVENGHIDEVTAKDMSTLD